MAYISWRPTEHFPRPLRTARKTSSFNSSPSDTIKLLERELDQVHAWGATVSLAAASTDLPLFMLVGSKTRLKVRHPGVILTFTAMAGNVRFSCDTFTTWWDNLRAIALSMEALRKVDSYHVVIERGSAACPPEPPPPRPTPRPDFRADYEASRRSSSPPPPPPPPRASSLDYDMAALVCLIAGISSFNGYRTRHEIVAAMLTNPDLCKTIWRMAVKKAHPDAGGDTRTWLHLQTAADHLKKQHVMAS